MVPSIELNSDHSMTVTGLIGWMGWTFRVRQEDGGAEAVEVIAPKGEAVTAELWRRMPIGTALRMARGATQSLYVELVAANFGESTRRPYGGSPEHDARVVALYRAAVSQGLSPGAVVGEHFGVDVKTAGRWIAALRSSDRNPAGPLGTFAEESARVGAPPAPKRKPTPEESNAALREVPRLIDEARARSGRSRSTKSKGGTR